ncbi:anthrone oxygenase family protein [Gymnodinialimonas sp.]
MRRVGIGMGTASVLFAGAIFGFFYAWVCSTMWGLDAADPRVAIAAMQAMNASVRNAVFFPAFFLTPVVLLGTAVVTQGAARGFFAGGGVVYLFGGLILTMVVNVPMNEALAVVEVPQDIDAARAIWAEYSPRWQVFNVARTVASGVALLLAGLGLWSLGRTEASQPRAA